MWLKAVFFCRFRYGFINNFNANFKPGYRKPPLEHQKDPVMNKMIISIFVFCLSITTAGAQSITIIPEPAQSVPLQGSFTLTAGTSVIAPDDWSETARLFAGKVEEVTGIKPSINQKGNVKGNIMLRKDGSVKGSEAYELDVRPDGIEIRASAKGGAYYGLQTVAQLLAMSENGKIAAVSLKDRPAFTWRGVMLDVSRTFMPVNLVKRYIDLFSFYKLNTVHLHLTDDQGWRIEIKKYPLLTEVGSKFDAKYNRMGGYYSQDDIRELVKYAGSRNITLVPEIELPGHACAALASYPWLSCAGIKPEIHTFFEGPSVHKEILCAGKPEVYEFIFNVLDELAALFPSEYIHIGGDEAPKDEWKKCSYCQGTMKENGLKDEEELQSYFVKRIGEHLRSKNRILIGWDEIYDGGKLKGDEVLMFWRGWKAESVEKAAAGGFRIVASPTTHCYFDYDYKSIDTRKIFDYYPVPETATAEAAKNYIGVQANFWSHIDRSEANIDKQLLPRLLGLAEAAWTDQGNRNWEKFKTSAKMNSEYLRKMNFNVYPDSSLKY
jgi:hexosaminidase